MDYAERQGGGCGGAAQTQTRESLATFTRTGWIPCREPRHGILFPSKRKKAIISLIKHPRAILRPEMDFVFGDILTVTALLFSGRELAEGNVKM